MSLYDIYVISPPLAIAMVGILVILLDLVVQRKRALPAFALVGLIVPALLLVAQFQDLGNTRDLLESPAAMGNGKASVLLGSLVVDRFALFFGFLVLAATALVILASVDYVERLERRQGEYYGLVLFSATGMVLLASASELVTIYISLELTTLPIVALAAFHTSSKSSEAGMKFLIIGAISSAVMLYGMALVFGFTQTTDLTGIASKVAETTGGLSFENLALLTGVVLIVAGFGFKISSAPFQMWVPDIYEGAPTPVVAFLSVASKAAAFAVLIRVFYTGFFGVGPDWGVLMAILAAVSMTVGNLVAMSQSNIRRLFGYSAIAHAGYILVGVAAGVEGSSGGTAAFVSVGPNSVLFYLGAYTAANLTAFFAIVVIGSRTGSDQIDDYAGMVQRAPVLAIVLTLALIALVGVPPTSIFIAKLYVFTAAVKGGLAWLAIVGVINSVVSAYYYLRIIRVMFLQPPPSDERIPMSPSSWVAIAASGAAMVWMGVAPGFVLRAAEIAVATLAVQT